MSLSRKAAALSSVSVGPPGLAVISVPLDPPGLHSPVRGRGDANGPKGSRIIPFFLPGMQMKPMAGSGKKIRGRWRGEYGTMAAGARKCADMTRSRDPMCPRT
ncbi:unnamed protein product, partial [Nesidiocoris tenuis]